MIDLEATLAEHRVTPHDLVVSLGVSRQCVSLWATNKRRISPVYARTINERFRIPLWKLRPDIWEAPRPPPTRKVREAV